MREKRVWFYRSEPEGERGENRRRREIKERKEPKAILKKKQREKRVSGWKWNWYKLESWRKWKKTKKERQRNKKIRGKRQKPKRERNSK